MNESIQVIYEDNHLLVVNKPAGMLVQGDSTGDKPLSEYAKEYVKRKYNKPGAVFMGVIHRLDRPVSGVVVLARTSKALERMNKIFHDRKVQKVYWAIVKRRPSELKGKLVHYLIKDSSNNTVKAFDKMVEGAQLAELSYKFLGSLNNHHLLEVYPVTGRPHQIRVQLASMGSPIRGDIKYGFHKPNQDGSINLHAMKIFFEHPVKKEPMTFKATLPGNDFWQQFSTFDNLKVKDKDLDKLY